LSVRVAAGGGVTGGVTGGVPTGGVVVPAPMAPMYSSLFGEPLPGLVTLPAVASATMASRTWAGVRAGLFARYSAATPVTCGVAIEVPLIRPDAVSLPFIDD